MQRKKAKPKAKKAEGPTAVAKDAGCSKGLAHRLLKRGHTSEEITERIAENKRRKDELLELPPTPVTAGNGHAADIGFMTFSGAQTAKENWLCELRKIEVLKARGELIPLAYVRHWGVRFLVAAREELEKGPGELQDALAAECDPAKCADIVRGWIERVVAKLYETERLWGPPLDDEAA